MPSAIVVDSPIMRTQLGKLLELAGFSVVAQAGAADHLLELYEQHRPDLITLDIVVPGPVTWVFPRPIALELVRRLRCEPDPPPETATDGATELANILTGRASEVLERHGFHCEFGVPRLHSGALPVGIAVRMTTANGPIDVVLSMAQTPAERHG